MTSLKPPSIILFFLVLVCPMIQCRPQEQIIIDSSAEDRIFDPLMFDRRLDNVTVSPEEPEEEDLDPLTLQEIYPKKVTDETYPQKTKDGSTEPKEPVVVEPHPVEVSMEEEPASPQPQEEVEPEGEPIEPEVEASEEPPSEFEEPEHTEEEVEEVHEEEPVHPDIEPVHPEIEPVHHDPGKEEPQEIHHLPHIPAEVEPAEPVEPPFPPFPGSKDASDDLEPEDDDGTDRTFDLPKELMPIHPGGGSKFEDLNRIEEDEAKTKMADEMSEEGKEDEENEDDIENGNSHSAEGLYSLADGTKISGVVVMASLWFTIFL